MTDKRTQWTQTLKYTKTGRANKGRVYQDQLTNQRHGTTNKQQVKQLTINKEQEPGNLTNTEG